MWGGGGGWAVAEVGGSGRKWGRQIFFFGDTIQRLQYVLAHVNDSNTTAHVQCYLCIESKKEFFGKLPLPPDCRPIAATPNLFLFWHDTEVAMGTSTCIWLKHINLRPVLPLHWVKKGIWWKITLPPTSARLPPDCRPIAARLPPCRPTQFVSSLTRYRGCNGY